MKLIAIGISLVSFTVCTPMYGFTFSKIPEMTPVDNSEILHQLFGTIEYTKKSINDYKIAPSRKAGNDSGNVSDEIKHNSSYKEYPLTDYVVLLDCSTPTRALKMAYTTVRRDTGNVKRKSSFYIEPSIPRECQQKSTGTYSDKVASAPMVYSYHRGHFLQSNMFDYSEEAIKASNAMVNVLPQLSTNNIKGGAWYETEMLLECMRDDMEKGPIGIEQYVGPIYGDDKDDDFFIKSHGVETPSYYWKIIKINNGGKETAYTWLIPNTKVALKKELNIFLTTPYDLYKKGAPRELLDHLSKDLQTYKALDNPKFEHTCDIS